MFKKNILSLIHFYQKTISPDHGFFSQNSSGACRFYPSCSEYTRQAIEKYGPARGILKGFGRIFRCHPFSRGGADPLK